jgi:hypothetical protein
MPGRDTNEATESHQRRAKGTPVILLNRSRDNPEISALSGPSFPSTSSAITFPVPVLRVIPQGPCPVATHTDLLIGPMIGFSSGVIGR